MSNLCPCGKEKEYKDCCGPFHKGESLPRSAEDTMRSRYCAFVKKEVDYILSTHDPNTVHEINKEEVESWANDSEWMGLEIVETKNGKVEDKEGMVEFIASYKSADQEFRHRERSTFVKKEGKWFFHDGQIVREAMRRESPKVGRNDPCPCGSGKKYKKCCLY